MPRMRSTEASNTAPPRLGVGSAWQWGGMLAAWMVGLAGLQFVPSWPNGAPALGAALGLALLVAAAWRRSGLGVGVAALVLGLSWAGWRADARLASGLDPAWEGHDLVVEGEVVGLPTAVDGFGGVGGWRLVVEAEGPARDPISGDAVPIPRGLSLNWFPGAGHDLAPRAGERWRWTLRLKRVHLPQNPHLPDAELWLLERGIRAQGSVLGGVKLQPAPAHSLVALRERLRDAIASHVEAPRHRAVLGGLVLGDQAALPAGDWALLRDAGVVHLFSISGLHITAFAWLASLAVRRLWRTVPGLALTWPAPSAARWLGWAAALAYALLAGWGVPAQRTVGLITVLALLGSAGRQWPWPVALLLAGAVVGAADPWALVQPGFWMSFVAVAVLMHGGAAVREGARLASALRELVRTQALITVGLLPLSLLFFGQVSVAGVAVNLVAVPLVSLALTPLSLLGLLLPPLWTVAEWLTDALWALMRWATAWPGAVWTHPQAPSWAMALALVGVAAALTRLPWRWRWAGGLAAAPLLLWTPARPTDGHFRITVMDVGQGSALWVQTARHDLLFDAGPRWGPAGQDAGARTVLPLLRAEGVRRLDAVVLSHGDTDHSGGAVSVAQGLPVRAWWGRVAPTHPLHDRLHPCVAGTAWDWDGVRLQWLHPTAATPGWDNAASCVLHVQDRAGRAALLTGDLPAAQEREMLERSVPGALRADLLLAPHHGSASSSTPALIEAVAPRLALAQSGYRNRHGHPALVVRQRYAVADVPLLTSAACGAFEWWSAHGAPSPQGCWRGRERRYWWSSAEPASPAPHSLGPFRPDGPDEPATMPP